MDQSYKKIIVKLVISYLCILIVPLILISLIYSFYVQNIKEYASTQSQSNITALQENVDTRLRELEAISTYLASNEKVISLLNSDKINYETTKIYDIYDLTTSLPNFKRTNTILTDTEIFFQKAEYMVSPNGAVPYNKDFYQHFMSENVNLPSFEGLDQILFNTTYVNRYITFPGYKSPVSQTYYINSLPAGTQNPRGVILIPISQSFLNNILQSIDAEKNGFLVIADQNNKILSYHLGENCDLPVGQQGIQNLENLQSIVRLKDYIVTGSVSSYNGWQYCSIIPTNSVMKNVQFLQNVIILLMVLSLTFCVLMMLFTLRDKVSILRKLFAATDVLNIHVSQKSYKYVENAIDQLVHSSNNLLQSITNQQSVLKSSVARRLMYGDYYDSKDLEYFEKTLQLDIRNNRFMVLILHFEVEYNKEKEDNLGYLSFIGIYVKKTLEKHINKKYDIFDIDESNIAVLLINERESDDDFIAFVRKLTDDLKADLFLSNQIRSKYAISASYSGIKNIRTAYKEAFDINHFMRSAGSEAERLFSFECSHNSDYYYYPLDLEMRLIQLVKYGDQKELSKVFHIIYDENFVKRNLSLSVVKQLVFAMRATVVRGFKDIILDENINAMMETLTRAYSTDEIFNSVIRINTQMCRSMNEIQSEKNEQQRGEIQKLLDENYADCTFTIHSVAKTISMSETTTYQLIKELFGKTFAETLEQRRIEAACKLLSNNDCQVKDVAADVGYSSDVSFRRAFKRVMGVTPSEYTAMSASQ